MIKQIALCCIVFPFVVFSETAIQELNFQKFFVRAHPPTILRTDATYMFYEGMVMQAMKDWAPQLLRAEYLEEGIRRLGVDFYSETKTTLTYFFEVNITFTMSCAMTWCPVQKWFMCALYTKRQGESTDWNLKGTFCYNACAMAVVEKDEDDD